MNGVDGGMGGGGGSEHKTKAKVEVRDLICLPTHVLPPWAPGVAGTSSSRVS